jgi:hypothetical protein
VPAIASAGSTKGRAPRTAAAYDRPVRLTSWLALLAVSIAATPAHAEFCGAVGLQPEVVSSAELVLPGDGGILVAAVPGMSHDERDVADQPSWTFRTGGASSTPRRTTLAPGLVVYQARQDGTVVLLDQEDRQRATAFVTRRARARLAAPVIKWAVRAPDRIDVFLELASAPPEDAIAIVLAGKDGKARSWDFIDPESTIQRAYKQRGCETQPAGTTPSNAGDEVTFFFVDLYGRPSARTKSMRIVDKTPSERRLSRD